MSTAFRSNPSLSAYSPPPYAQQTENAGNSSTSDRPSGPFQAVRNPGQGPSDEQTDDRAYAEQSQHQQQQQQQQQQQRAQEQQQCTHISSLSNRRRPKQQRVCYICKSRNLPSNVQEIGPFLIHRSRPSLILVCPCLHRVHPACLKKYNKTDYICNQCNSIYRSKRFIRIAQCINFLCHLLSLASTVGLIFGLSHLGRALDELGLGDEFGPKLDGDETWHDHEMLEIVEWLNMVHFATGVAGEALLGLVYLLGVCLVIGLDRTLVMISHILYIRLNAFPSNFGSVLPKWIKTVCVCICLFILGLVLGTYLLFFSWIWASALHHIRKQLFECKKESFQYQDAIDREKSVIS